MEAVKAAGFRKTVSIFSTQPGIEGGPARDTQSRPKRHPGRVVLKPGSRYRSRLTRPPSSTTPPRRFTDIKPRLLTAAYSPDGRTIATTAGADEESGPGELVLWDAATGRVRVVIRQGSAIRSAAFSPDGRRLTIGDDAGQLTISTRPTGAEVLKLPQQEKPIWAVAFSPDGSIPPSGGRDGAVRLWDGLTGKCAVPSSFAELRAWWRWPSP
jgi:WD40 repeat protein